MRVRTLPKALSAAVIGLSLLGGALHASSHREAPAITEMPRVDGTDFYMFRSYEPGREDFVTFVANYLPLQDAYGGPNYFALDSEALYEIHVDSDGDAVEDLTFQFRFQTEVKGIALEIGAEGDKRTVEVPLINVGPIGGEGDDPLNPGALNRLESYGIQLVRGPRRGGQRETIVDAGSESTTFAKPVDNIGTKSIPDYEGYARNFLHSIRIPGVETPGRVFVGQRKDPFVVNLGATFDLVNLDPLGPETGGRNDLADKNVTSIILEVPIAALVKDDQPVIGAWTTASRPQGRVLNPRPGRAGEPGQKGASVQGGAWTQVSRLGHPLVNEVVIGLRDKDRFNASHPSDDAQFATYVTHPTLPALLEVLFGVRAPSLFPRADLVATFLTGIPELNQPPGVVPAEMLRLNTSIPPTPRDQQSDLGVLGGDLAGFPNGRRPGDDVVDLSLRVVMGVLVDPGLAPDGLLPYTDGAGVQAADFLDAFPYLASPIAGAGDDS